MEIRELRQVYSKLNEDLIKYGGLFDVAEKEEEIKKLEKETIDINFWNREDANEIIDKLNDLKRVVEPIKELMNNINNNISTLDEVSDDDIDIINIIEEEYDRDSKLFNKIELETYLSGKYDSNNCILEIHAGAGGTESCDWVSMLYRMYIRYLEKNNYKIEEMDKQDGEEAGIKSVMIRVIGKNAYGYLKHERGVHRLVRISPFDANKRRHTSFAAVEITPEIDKNVEIDINPNDLKIDIFRSSGPGGQGVNTTDSAVRITHLPSKIVVTCQNERSQIQNKEHCMEVLRSKLYALEMSKKDEEVSSINGEKMANAFGSGKRSYVMCPYTRVVDNESKYETADVDKVLDGELDEFINSGLRV
ncbi:MAG: peptide chain release factor 2 [Bacilli bacterium]|nr:peptide chain release factor 2 [Bacilli bacterium]